jgi:hypothetical protein
MGEGGQCHALAALPPRKRPGTHCTVGCVDTRAGLNGCGKPHPPTGIRPPDRPARSESLYRLRYTGPHFTNITLYMLGGPQGRSGKQLVLLKKIPVGWISGFRIEKVCNNSEWMTPQCTVSAGQTALFLRLHVGLGLGHWTGDVRIAALVYRCLQVAFSGRSQLVGRE